MPTAQRPTMNNHSINPCDRAILRDLGRRKCEIGSLPIHRHKFDAWGRLNRLQPTRPMVWINEIPWHELNVGGVLNAKCQDPFLAGVERGLRMELYQWDHFRCDMVVEPVIYCGLVGGPTSSYADYGLKEVVDAAVGGQDVLFRPIIHTEADADQIVTPKVWFDRDATERNYRTLCEVFDGVIPVKKRGIVHQWHSPWDQIIHWYGVEQLYTDMYDRPALVHRILGNFMRALHSVVDQQEELGMLDVGNGNYRVGSGGMGITDELPDARRDGQAVTTRNQWGCATAQIFSDVSSAMHEEFALQYERPLMHRYALTYYGCCEPLHKKLALLRTIKNLRKVSMSPWINPAEASEAMGADFVFSFKPNPAHLATDEFDEELVRSYLRGVLQQTRNNRVEVILKDITTVRCDPSRIDRWASIAMELVQAL